MSLDHGTEAWTDVADDLLALANAVREVGFSDSPSSGPQPGNPDSVVELGRRGHLRVIADAQRRI